MKSILKEFKDQKKRKLLIVISGPTCAGKDAIIKSLLKRNKNITRLVTTNSRLKRAGEKEGVDYYFVSKDQFEKLISRDAFFEWVEYRGDYRGTQKKHVKQFLESGKDVIWRIDVRGVKNVYRKVKKEIPFSVFIFVGERLSILEKRLKKRATENKKWRDWSKNRAKWELAQFARNFDYLVLNKQGKLKKTVRIIKGIIESERRRLKA